jgi:hypothetical protein
MSPGSLSGVVERFCAKFFSSIDSGLVAQTFFNKLLVLAGQCFEGRAKSDYRTQWVFNPEFIRYLMVWAIHPAQ